MTASLINPSLEDTIKIVLVVAFATTLLFTASYVIRANWRRDPVGWVVVGDRSALTLILALIGVQTFWTLGIGTVETLLWIEVGLMVVIALVSLVAAVFLFRVQREGRRKQKERK